MRSPAVIRRILRALASRGEMPDPVDHHYAAAAAILRPDSLPDPGWCLCESCVDVLFALMVWRDLIPPTEEFR